MLYPVKLYMHFSLVKLKRISNKRYKNIGCMWSVAIVVLTLNTLPAVAQDVPDAGTLQREIESQQPPKDIELPKEEPPPKPPTEKTGPVVPVTHFSFYGNTLLPSSELNDIVEPWVRKKLSLAELNYVTSLIAARYNDKGYLARVYLPKQDINDGRVIIAIAEAKFGAVNVDGRENIESTLISPAFVEDTVSSGLEPGEVLSLKRLERTTLVVNDLSGIKVQNVLVAGQLEGTTDISVKVSPEPKVTGAVSLDSYGVKSTGEFRLMPSLQIANPFHRGDDLALIGLFSKGNQYGRMNYGYPFGSNGLRANVSASYLSYELGDEFEELDAQGDASTVGVDMHYPLRRQLRSNIHIVGGFERRTYSNEQLGENVSDKNVDLLKMGVRGNHFDGFGQGGAHYYSASLSIGNLDLSGNVENQAQDAASSKTEGGYTVLAWNYGRFQQLASRTSLWASFQGQFTSEKLDSSETLSLGGPNGIRAYPVLEASGDTGAVMILELRQNFDHDFTLSGFVDYGRASQKATEIQDGQSISLKGFGVTGAWSPLQHISAHLTVARRIGENPLRDPETGNDTNGEKTLFPVWLRVTMQF